MKLLSLQPSSTSSSILDGGGVIYLSTTSPGSSSLQISPLGSPVLHQLAPPNFEDKSGGVIFTAAAAAESPQIELRDGGGGGSGSGGGAGGGGELDLRAFTRQQSNDAFDLSLNSSGPMGPPPAPPPVQPPNSVYHQDASGMIRRLSAAEHSYVSGGNSKSPASEMMRPPPAPPPSSNRRGRGGGGRGSRGGAVASSPRGRGRGRGRGKSGPGPPAFPQPSSATAACSSSPSPATGTAAVTVVTAAVAPAAAEIGHQPEENGEEATKQPSPVDVQMSRTAYSFQLGEIQVQNSLFDKLLNRRKLELLEDPDIRQLLAASRKNASKSSSKQQRK